MTRLYVKADLQEEETLTLSGSQRRYLCTVLRMRPGQELSVFDGSGWEYRARFVSADRKSATLAIMGKRQAKTESPLRIVLAQALLRAEKMDIVIQKSVELGVSAIYPFTCERTVAASHMSRGPSKIDRWRRISIEASEQSSRTRIPEVGTIISFKEILYKRPSVDLGIVCSLQGTVPIGEAARGTRLPESVLILVGPEGGFTDQEITEAVAEGFVAASLGPRTLRAETSALIAVGLVQYLFGDLRRYHYE